MNSLLLAGWLLLLLLLGIQREGECGFDRSERAVGARAW